MNSVEITIDDFGFSDRSHTKRITGEGEFGGKYLADAVVGLVPRPLAFLAQAALIISEIDSVDLDGLGLDDVEAAEEGFLDAAVKVIQAWDKHDRALPCSPRDINHQPVAETP